MDFAWTDEQKVIRDLARRILTDLVSDDAIKAFEPTKKSYFARVWEELSRAEILSLPLSEDNGGGGMSELELSLVLKEIGRVAAPIPIMSALIFAAMPLDRFGTGAQKSAAKNAVADTPTITGAWSETQSRDALRPAATLSKTAGGYLLQGVKTNVEAADVAQAFVVNAQLDGAPALVIARRDATVTLTEQEATNLLTVYQVRFENTPIAAEDVIVLGDKAREAIAWTMDRAWMAQSAIMLGLADTALALTADYATKRVQFGQPIAMFQAVGQRAADCYIDLQSMELMTLRAAWLQAEGLPSTDAAQKAKFVAADGGHRIVAAASHLHGGMGFDRDYPLYRYFLSMKLYEFTHGGANAQLGAIGRRVAGNAQAGA